MMRLTSSRPGKEIERPVVAGELIMTNSLNVLLSTSGTIYINTCHLSSIFAAGATMEVIITLPMVVALYVLFGYTKLFVVAGYAICYCLTLILLKVVWLSEQILNMY